MKDWLIRARKGLQAQRRRSRWKKLVGVMAMVVTFGITYAMILPAITMEREYVCGITEHVHTEECYTQQQVLSCGLQEDDTHMHDESCLETEQVLSCGLEEHTHTEICYQDIEPQPEETYAAETSDVPEPTETSDVPEPADTPEVNEPEITLTTDVVSFDAASTAETVVYDPVPTATGEDTGSDTSSDNNGFQLGDTEIKKLVVSYKNDENKWVEITEETEVSGDAELRLEVNFSVKKTEVETNNYRIVYNVPDFLRIQEADGLTIQDSNNEPIGTIAVEQQKFILVLNEEWVKKQPEDIQGTFYMESKLNLSYIKENPDSSSLTIGNLTINVTDVEDWVARYNSLEVEKKLMDASDNLQVEHTDDGDYLIYQLTATAGPDGVENARIIDYFTAGNSYVAEYVGVTTSAVSTDSASLAGAVTEEHPEGTEAGTVYYGDASTQPVPTPDGSGAKPGTMVWQIGKMQPNEVRTLTYKVKLVDGYSAKLQSKNITNQADAYSGDYKRDESSAIFTPKGKATMSKTAEINLDSDGIGGSITYTIWVQALPDNNFILDDVKLYDFYVKYGSNNSVQAMPGYVTMPQAEDFRLLDASGNALSIEDLNPEKDAGNPVINTEDKSFVCYVGPLEPGEERTLQYTIRLEDAAFLTDDYNEEDGTLRLCNRARIFPGNEEHKVTGGNSLEGYTVTNTLNHYTWCTKAVGKETLSADTVFEINSGDKIFTLQNGKLEPETSDISEFTVQAGSVSYEVKINPSGVLNVNSVTMKDALGQFLRYAGYVRVDAFQKPSGADQYTTVDYAREPVKTVWVDIDGESQFTFSPKDLGFDEDVSYAYMLTYFASPYGIEEGNLQTVNNDFILTGQVGPNGIYTLSGIEVSASATVFGTSRFNAEKRAWYYSRPAADADENWSKGELYWYIEISGTAIPNGTSLQDQPGTNHKIKADSLVGVFYGKLPDGAADAAALETLTPLKEGEDYTAEQDLDSNNLTLTFLEEYPLEEENSVYIVVKTSPTTLPGKLGFASYENGLYLRNNEGVYIENQTPVSQTIAGDDGISKEAKLAFTCDSEGNKTLLWATGGHEITDRYLDMEQIETPGIYTEWLVTVNYHGSLAGDYLVEDQLPDGMIPVYVRGYYIENSNVTSPDIAEYENSVWEKHTNTNRGNSTTQTTTWYYNPDTGQVQWAVNGLQSAPVTEGNQDNTQTAQYQIVCRVTDKDVLLGGQAKSIQNYVTLMDSNENQVGNDFDTVELEKRTPLDKQGAADGSIKDSNRYPFTITLNPEGIDLMPDSDTIRLVDELSDSLTLDPSSIRVVKLTGTQDAQTEEELPIEQYKVELDGQIMTITLPDDLPLRITYAAIINAAPGTPVDISNNAHWEGYASSDDTVVENKNFEYSVGAVLTGEKASLQLVKVDANDINQKLPGATFTVQEVTVDRTNPQNPVLGEAVEPIYTGTTDENGTVVFPEASENWMKYNTVYQLIETKAPDGYVLDKTPYYFALAVKQDDDTYLTFPEGVNVRYGVSKFQYTAFNQKGRIQVDKSFVGSDGSEIAVQGTYTFGLFEENPDVYAEASPVQRLAMTFESGKAPSYFRDGVKATTPTFKNLELNQTYYIRELDADGRPIANGGIAWLGNYCFEVIYTDADGMQPKSNSDETGTVSVQNKQILTYELPESGGTGTMIYEMLGSALMLGAGLGYFKMSKARKRVLARRSKNISQMISAEERGKE